MSVGKFKNIQLSDTSMSKYNLKYLNKVMIICLLTSLVTICPLIIMHKLTRCYFGPRIFRSSAKQEQRFHKTLKWKSADHSITKISVYHHFI